MIVVLVFLGNQAIANGMSELELMAKHDKALKVIIDGQLVATNSPKVDIKNIPSGNHYLQVFRVENSYYGYSEEVLFVGNVFLPQNTITKAFVKHHKFIIVEQMAMIPIQQNVVYNYQGNPYNQNQPAVCQNVIPIPKPEPIVELFPMSSEEFNLLRNAINNEWFSDGKLMIFKQAVNAGHLFTTAQVKQIIALYDFSSEQLEVAKIAYNSTLDTENYFLVFDTLHWSSSKKKLNNYIASL